MFDTLETRLAALQKRLGRWTILFPIISMAWGVASGITVSRDFEKSRHLIGYLVALVLASALLRIWTDRQAFKTGESEVKATIPSTRAARLAASLRKRPEIVSFPTLQVTQYCAQYIITFSLPLLYFARAWSTLGLVTALAATTLWDRWWTKLVSIPWYLPLVRLSCSVLALAFVVPVFFPQNLRWFYPLLAVSALLSSLPWDTITRRRPYSWKAFWLPLSVACVIVAEAAMGPEARFPLLSVWIKSPALGFGVSQRSLSDPVSSPMSRAQLASNLETGVGLCCLTPVMGPYGMTSTLVHEWRVNGNLVDVIQLPPIRGGGSTAPEYRTYSCKRYFANLHEIHSISCTAFLEGRHMLTEVEVAVVDIESGAKEPAP
jgi:hypothetical protein